MKDLNDIRMIFKDLKELNSTPGAMTDEGLVIIRQSKPARVDIGKVRSRYSQPLCIAARTIYELCDEVERLGSELGHAKKTHADAEKKMLKKLALKPQEPCGKNARPKQSNTAGKTN